MAKREISRGDILRLAAEAGLDPRTVKRALERGVEKMQAAVDKERIRAAAVKLGIKIE
jgi:predicted DsbA family dithiol-disulfide isomerase